MDSSLYTVVKWHTEDMEFGVWNFLVKYIFIFIAVIQSKAFRVWCASILSNLSTPFVYGGHCWCPPPKNFHFPIPKLFLILFRHTALPYTYKYLDLVLWRY